MTPMSTTIEKLSLLPQDQFMKVVAFIDETALDATNVDKQPKKRTGYIKERIVDPVQFEAWDSEILDMFEDYL